jgi:hypothetical protein
MNGPTQGQIDNADYGIYPGNYEDLVNEYYTNKLIDPSSAEFKRIGLPHKEYLYDSRYRDVYFVGYLVCVTFNEKNSIHGYKGNQIEGVLIKNGKVFSTLEGGYWERRFVCQ